MKSRTARPNHAAGHGKPSPAAHSSQYPPSTPRKGAGTPAPSAFHSGALSRLPHLPEGDARVRGVRAGGREARAVRPRRDPERACHVVVLARQRDARGGGDRRAADGAGSRGERAGAVSRLAEAGAVRPEAPPRGRHQLRPNRPRDRPRPRVA